MANETTHWETVSAGLHDRAKALHQAREEILIHCRKLGQIASKCIRSVHRHEFDRAQGLLAEARLEANSARTILSRAPELNAAYLHDSEKELIEAAIVLAIVHHQPYPRPEEFETSVFTYLHGAGEAASEVRRFALDEMRRGNFQNAERILEEMEAIYEELITFDYSDAMTGGLRRTTDALRAVIERTRSDLTLTLSQQQLIAELKANRKED